jgi:hypothetical protein
VHLTIWICSDLIRFSIGDGIDRCTLSDWIWVCCFQLIKWRSINWSVNWINITQMRRTWISVHIHFEDEKTKLKSFEEEKLVPFCLPIDIWQLQLVPVNRSSWRRVHSQSSTGTSTGSFGSSSYSVHSQVGNKLIIAVIFLKMTIKWNRKHTVLPYIESCIRITWHK